MRSSGAAEEFGGRQEFRQSAATLSSSHVQTTFPKGFDCALHLVQYCRDMDPQLLLFRRQYLQLFEPDFLAWPPKPLLKDASVQSWLYSNLFDTEKHTMLPPERYQLRVLKPLLSKIEQAIEDPEEDVGILQ